MMGGPGSGNRYQKKRLPRHVELKGIHARGMKKSFKEVAFLMGFHIGLDRRLTKEKRLKAMTDRLDRYRRNWPDFDLELEAAEVGLSFNCISHSIQSAFPVNPDGSWKKGDSSLARHLLQALFGVRDNITTQDVAQALAPLIQFAVKEPVDATAQANTSGSYFDPPKEAEVG